jgi:hypothetical protein
VSLFGILIEKNRAEILFISPVNISLFNSQTGSSALSANPLSTVERRWLRREIEDWLQAARQFPQ